MDEKEAGTAMRRLDDVEIGENWTPAANLPGSSDVVNKKRALALF
ncbi:MAG: hypothetical protein V4582_19780 [Pseudomonadota bacterium]